MNVAGLFFGLFVAVLGYMTAWFVIARLTDRADVVDTAWGLGFVYVAWLTWLMVGKPGGVPLVGVLFVTVWGLRLAAHIFTRNHAKSEDHRYMAYRKKWGSDFWLNTYIRIFLLQGVLLLSISSTAVASINTKQPGSFVTVIGLVVWMAGIVYEAVADYQLRQFVKTKKPGEIMQAGLWRYSRHPNYFGEITSWWGAAIVGLSYAQWWALFGAGVITLLITKVSGVPLLERHYADNSQFQEYKKHTSILIPLPRR
ncbi:MAG TPA: DUF1295 domain-containing protein [Candidatus Microsaccharimonas sp.]|nr:DUF1295 domain-containing protein [Candidatus Microsaccharimonas sp.]